MAYKPITRNGHSMYDMASMLQKSIRRGDFNHAGYAANELYPGYYNYLWKRLLVISAEDCYGIITKEIVGLRMASDMANQGRKGDDIDPIFIAKAITLLCAARKNRDACYFACNFMCIDRLIPEDQIEHIDLEACDLTDEGIPDWVFDIHTLRGRMNGKTDLDMTIDEQAALNPLQLGFFDEEDWKPYYDFERSKGSFKEKEWRDIEAFIKSKQDLKVSKVKECFEKGDVISALKGVHDFKLSPTPQEHEIVKYAYEILRSNKVIEKFGEDADEIISDALDVLERVMKDL